MKTLRIILCLSVCCVLIGIVGLVAPRVSKAQQMSNQSTNQFMKENAATAFFYKTISGNYYKPGAVVILRTWYQIYNTSTSNSITLKNVYVLEGSGKNGPTVKWTVPNGIVIPPLGSYSFEISDTCIEPWTNTDGRHAFHTIVTWMGEESDLKLIGVTAAYTDTSLGPVGYYSLASF